MTLRKIKVSLDFFKQAIQRTSLPYDEIEPSEIRDQIKKMGQGTYCLYIDE